MGSFKDIQVRDKLIILDRDSNPSNNPPTGYAYFWTINNRIYLKFNDGSIVSPSVTETQVNELRKNLSAGVRGTLPTFTENSDLTIDIGSCEVSMYATSDHTGNIDTYTVAAASGLSVPSNQLSYVIVELESDGTAVFDVITDVSLINESNVLPIYTMYNDTEEIHVLDWDSLGDGLANKLNKRFVKTQRFARESGFALSEFGTRNLQLTAGVLWNGAVEHDLEAVDSTSSDSKMLLYYHSSGTWVRTAITQYNNTQYDDGTNLQTLSNNKYTVNWVYRTVDIVHKELLIVLSDAEYNTFADAENSQPPATPDIIPGTAVLVGRVIVEKNASSGTVESAFDKEFIAGAVTSHNDLSELQGGQPSEYYHATESQANKFPYLIGRNRVETVQESDGGIDINFANMNEAWVTSSDSSGGSITVDTDLFLAFLNASNAEGFQLFVNVTASAGVSFLDSSTMILYNAAESDGSYLISQGYHQIVGMYDGANWHIIISELGQ
jgi:hypothetical protein